MEVSFHHTDETTDLTYNARRTPEEVDEIIQFYNANLDLDHYLFTAWNKKKGIFEEFPFHKDADTGQWKINQSYIQEFVPRKSTKSAKTALFKPYQVVIQHLLLYEVAQCN
ncbi:MAG: hypothetical protein EOP45_15620 [Sphingobacteriaceae bacterium]|nr:MAG: hypothetical protein EOP45_15620 [Sphingobacteriaceae bacterium]